MISNEIKIKPQIFKRKFQKADVKKTHGSNKKIKKFTKINKFTNVDYAITSTAKWYKKNWKIFN